MLCVDNTDFMRNGDFVPTRLQAQQDAVSLIAHSKHQGNPENSVGLMTMGSVEVLMTLCSDMGRLLSKLHQIQPASEEIRFSTGIRVAHLALRHRQSRNQKMRIVVFVGSPIAEDDKELVRLARRLKKEKVNVDVINFGEEEANEARLAAFVDAVNGKDGVGSHLVTVPAGSMLHDSLMSSAIVVGEDGRGAPVGAGSGGGGGFEFGIDPNEDPELALALRVSMEEQRARQEADARSASGGGGMPESGLAATAAGSSEDALLQAALRGVASADDGEAAGDALAAMTEDEQIAYALQMSMAAAGAPADAAPAQQAMDEGGAESAEEAMDEVMDDPEFLASVLQQLPGVDPDAAAAALDQSQAKAVKKPEEKK